MINDDLVRLIQKISFFEVLNRINPFKKYSTEQDSEEDFYLENWNLLDVDSAKFILDQAEKDLNSTINSADAMNNRALTILKFFIPMIIIFISYLATNFSIIQIASQLALYGAIHSMLIVIYAFKVYDLYKAKPTGNSPVNIIENDDLKNYPDDLHKMLLYNSLKSIQDSINFNKRENKKTIMRIGVLYFLIKIGLIIPVVFLIIHLIHL